MFVRDFLFCALYEDYYRIVGSNDIDVQDGRGNEEFVYSNRDNNYTRFRPFKVEAWIRC